MYFTISVIFDELRKNKRQFISDLIRRASEMAKYIVYHLLHEQQKRRKLSKFSMDKLFLSAKARKRVPYNLKKQFMFKTREYQEIRDWAWEAYQSHISRTSSQPFSNGRTKTTRRLNLQRDRGNGKYTTGTAMIESDPLVSDKYWLLCMIHGARPDGYPSTYQKSRRSCWKSWDSIFWTPRQQLS